MIKYLFAALFLTVIGIAIALIAKIKIELEMMRINHLRHRLNRLKIECNQFRS